MAKIFKLHEHKPIRLGHKKARKSKGKILEEKGQLNIFKAQNPTIIELPQRLSPFENAFKYDEDGDLEKARELYQKAIEHNDAPADAYCNLGIIESLKGKYSEAIDNFSKALAQEPRHFEAHFNLANLYFDHEEWKLARLHYESARNINSEDAHLYFNLGLVQTIQKDVKAAIESFNNYCEKARNENTDHARVLLKQLKATNK